MTPELAYFLKINIAIALFYAFYRLFSTETPSSNGEGQFCFASLSFLRSIRY